MVRESLAALYETDLRPFPAALTAKAAQDYDGAVMHPEFARYHDPNAGLNQLPTLDFVAKSKEAAVGVMAVGVLVWGWARRRRERPRRRPTRSEAAARHFIRRHPDVELEQMEVTDPEELRPFLRRVTQIKQDALRELTSEKVRGDQLFAIFLRSCRVSEKIQMRMMYGRMSETVEQV